MNHDPIRDVLARLESKLDKLDDKLDAHREEYLPRVAKLELRVEALEQTNTTKGARRWTTKQAAGVTGLTATLAVIVDYLKAAIGG